MVRLMIPYGKQMSKKELKRFMKRCDWLQKTYGYNWVQWELIWESAKDDDPDKMHYFALAAGQMEGLGGYW